MNWQRTRFPASGQLQFGVYTVSVSSCVVQTHAEFVSALTDDHERHVREIETKYQAKLRALQAQNDLRRKTELHELEERKNRQVHTLMRNHEKAFTDIKNYYNDITANNMALINTLKVMILTVISCSTLNKNLSQRNRATFLPPAKF